MPGVSKYASDFVIDDGRVLPNQTKYLGNLHVLGVIDIVQKILPGVEGEHADEIEGEIYICEVDPDL